MNAEYQDECSGAGSNTGNEDDGGENMDESNDEVSMSTDN